MLLKSKGHHLLYLYVQKALAPVSPDTVTAPSGIQVLRGTALVKQTTASVCEGGRSRGGLYGEIKQPCRLDLDAVRMQTE